MNVTHLYPPKGTMTGTGKLRPEDLGGTMHTLTIRETGEETYNGATNITLYFAETDKCFSVKNSNGRAMIDAFGPETDNWIGKRIVLGLGPEFPERDNAGQETGKMIQWIKLQEQETAALEQAPARARPVAETVGKASDAPPF